MQITSYNHHQKTDLQWLQKAFRPLQPNATFFKLFIFSLIYTQYPIKKKLKLNFVNLLNYSVTFGHVLSTMILDWLLSGDFTLRLIQIALDKADDFRVFAESGIMKAVVVEAVHSSDIGAALQ